jgi:hypothetical protein
VLTMGRSENPEWARQRWMDVGSHRPILLRESPNKDQWDPIGGGDVGKGPDRGESVLPKRAPDTEPDKARQVRQDGYGRKPAGLRMKSSYLYLEWPMHVIARGKSPVR